MLDSIRSASHNTVGPCPFFVATSFDVRIFLNRTIGNNTPAKTVAAQIMSGANIHVEMSSSDRPFVKRVVSSSDTRVVTSAIPPRKAGKYCNATFLTNGDKSTCIPVKNNTAIVTAPMLTWKPGRIMLAAIIPTALPITSSIRFANARNTLRYSLLFLCIKYETVCLFNNGVKDSAM